MSQVEYRAAETLLDKGVPITMRAPFLLRLFGKKHIHAVCPNPTGGTLFQINSYYLSMGITVKGLSELDFNSLIAAQVTNHKKVYRMVACALLNSRFLQFWFTRLLAWFLVDALPYKAVCRLCEILLIQGGIEDFMNIIGLGAKLNMMTPKTSQTTGHTS